MTYYWFAQLVGGIAFLIGVTTFFNRNDQRFRLQLALYSIVIGVHFFLMGANSAGISCLLNGTRTIISVRTKNIIVMFVFLILALTLGLLGLKSPVELLPIFGTAISTFALFRTSGLKTRCILWCATACWLIHNLWLGSIGGSLIEGSFLFVNGYTIIRFYRMTREGIDPFADAAKVAVDLKNN